MNGRIAKTNKTSQTAFRGFGGPQGMIVIEDILGRCAPLLGIDPMTLRAAQLLRRRPGHALRPAGPAPGTRAAAWDQVIATGDLNRRLEEVAGSTPPTRTPSGPSASRRWFGISFNLTAFNQGGALVHVYKDGSVLINHGGTEMGQGLHTKMLQVAATTLGIPLSKVRLAPTRTDKVPNTSATAARLGRRPQR